MVLYWKTYLLWEPWRHKWHLKCVAVRMQCVKRFRRYSAKHWKDATWKLITNCKKTKKKKKHLFSVLLGFVFLLCHTLHSSLQLAGDVSWIELAIGNRNQTGNGQVTELTWFVDTNQIGIHVRPDSLANISIVANWQGKRNALKSEKRKKNWVKCHDRRFNHFRPCGDRWSINSTPSLSCVSSETAACGDRWTDRYCDFVIIKFRWKMSLPYQLWNGWKWQVCVYRSYRSSGQTIIHSMRWESEKMTTIADVKPFHISAHAKLSWAQHLLKIDYHFIFITTELIYICEVCRLRHSTA